MRVCYRLANLTPGTIRFSNISLKINEEIYVRIVTPQIIAAYNSGQCSIAQVADPGTIPIVENDRSGEVQIEWVSNVGGGSGPPAPPPPPGSTNVVIGVTSSELFDMPPGYAVYKKTDGTVGRATANLVAKANVVGLTLTTLYSGGSANIQTGDIMSLVASEWDTATGMVGGLVVGATYYLSGTLGQITPFPPDYGSGIGALTSIGTALSSTDLLIELEKPILF